MHYRGVKNLLTASGKRPHVAPSAQVHALAVLIGDVTIEADAQVWPGALIRGNPLPVVISKGAIIMEDSVILSDLSGGVAIGEMSLVGQRALLVGCKVGSKSLIGPGARILEGATIGNGCIIEQAVVIGPHTNVQSGTLVGGSGVKGPVSKAQCDMFLKHREGISKKFFEYGPLKVLKEDG
jgi:carbonic anhydrase/acetyltransferase-like protein (isoleucine patch superfamily)